MTVAARPKSQTSRAVEALRELIFTGELPAGSNHLESELAERLGMSRTPVREATLMLEAQGLLEVRPRKGVRILSLSVEDMGEIYEILTELESLAAERAAAKQYGADELSVLAHAIKEMEKAVTEENREAWAEADEVFHRELVRLSGNSRIAAIVNTYNDQVRRARSMTLNMRPMPVKSNRDHHALFDAISAGNASEARKIHWTHRSEAKTMMTDLLLKLGLKQV